MSWENGSFRRAGGAVVCLCAAVVAVTACSSEPDEATQATQQASTLVNGVPCSTKEHAITATSGKVTVQASSLVDAYDSSAGTYGGSNVIAAGTVQAGTQIVVTGGTVNGQRLPNTPLNLAIVPVPSGAIKLPLGASTPGNININGAADSITLPPGNYVVQNMNVNFSGAIRIAPAGEVNIFVLGTLNLGGVENPAGSPKNLTFFVQSTNTVNVNSNGQLFGSIYAPKAPVLLNSAIFGSVVGSQVTLNSGSAVHLDRGLTCVTTPPVPVRPPRTLPPPPTKNGCYLGTPNGWREVACTDESKITQYFPVPDPAVESYAGTVPAPILLQYGEVDLTFSTFGQAANDGSAAKLDELSFQANTNYFPRSAGQTGWVQFVIQTLPSPTPAAATKTAICIWDFLNTSLPYQYKTKCVGDIVGDQGATFFPYTVYRRPGTFKQFDFATVGGSVFASNGQRKIGMVAQISWFDPDNDPDDDRGLYSVVKDDDSGLADHWTAIGGGAYGDGNGATAVFKDTSVVNRILAGSCVNATGPKPDVPWPGSCPTQAPLLPNTRIQEGLTTTGEKHNLKLVGGPLTLAAATPDLVFTQYLTSSEKLASDPTTPACLDGANRIYVKDNPNDNGVVPSNVNGEPFWQSPDLFIVPHGVPVDAKAPAPPIVVIPGQMYDAYMRVNNDYSCKDVGGVKVRMHIADPAALSSAWAPITSGVDYQPIPGGDAAGVTVPAGGRALVGPFPFQAPITGLGDGHRCVIGSLISANQDVPTDAFDAPGSYQVAQRNISIAQCSYPLTNATTGTGALDLTITADGAKPSLSGDNNLSMTFFDPISDWYNAWLPGAGTTYAVTHTGTDTTVRLGPPDGTIWMGRTSVTLPTVYIGAGVTVAAKGLAVLPPGGIDTTLSIEARMFGLYGFPELTNGGSCVQLAPAGVDCGNGTLNAGEECDDGNLVPGDGCDNRCKKEPFCGNGVVDPGEQCDDGNTNNTDGCLDVCLVSSGTGPFLERDGFVIMEAEHSNAKKTDVTTGDVWSQVTVGGASGGACMRVGPDSTTQFHTERADTESNAARLDYQVNFTNSGTWYVWVRGAAPTTNAYAGNSCHAGLDGSAQALNLNYAESGAYEWQRGTLTVSAAGQHIVNVFMREDGFTADKILLTRDAGYTPNGIAQAESSRL